MNRTQIMAGIAIVLATSSCLVASTFPVRAEQIDEWMLGDILPPVLMIEDTGINPYHIDFRLPLGVDATAIPGYYPPEAELVELSLDAPSYEEAMQADEEVLESLVYGTPYAFNGTRIVGAIHFRNPNGGHPFATIDVDGHGTHVASSAVGAGSGYCRACRLVMGIDGDGSLLDWAVQRPWIDAFSISYGSLAGISSPFGNFEPQSFQWHLSGRSVFTAAGNGGGDGFFVNIGDEYAGPPWVIRVGAGLTPGYWAPRPYDVVGVEAKMGAAHDQITTYVETRGTSIASPDVAGHYLELLWVARTILGETGGVHDGLLAEAAPGAPLPERGPLADGALTAEELERLLMLTASNVAPPVAAGVFWPPFSYFWQGYGFVDDDAMRRAVDVLRGESDPPTKEWEDYWASYDAYVRAAWGGTLSRCEKEAVDGLSVDVPAFVECIEGSGWTPTADVPHVLWPLGG